MYAQAGWGGQSEDGQEGKTETLAAGSRDIPAAETYRCGERSGFRTLSPEGNATPAQLTGCEGWGLLILPYTEPSPESKTVQT